MSEPIKLPDDPAEAFLAGYWQTPEWCDGVDDIVRELHRIRRNILAKDRDTSGRS